MEQTEFENLVIEAVESLPKFFKEKLENVDIIVEDWPTQDEAKGRLLLGLYQGIPLPSRNLSYTLRIPDKITIFREPIVLVSHSESELIKAIVKDTVEHEIAHHFGISDLRLQEIKKNSHQK